MQTATQLDGDKFKFMVTQQKPSQSNQSDVIFKISTLTVDTKLGKLWKEREQQRIKSIAKNITPSLPKSPENFPKLIFQWVCESAEISSDDPKLIINRGHGRKPMYVYGAKKRIQYSHHVIPYCQIRMCIMYLLGEYTSLSLHQIGKITGKHHTTVIHGKRKVNDYIQIKDEFVTRIITRTIEKIEMYVNSIAQKSDVDRNVDNLPK